jgi:hypothetical protein
MTTSSQTNASDQQTAQPVAPPASRRPRIPRPLGGIGFRARDRFGPDSQRWRSHGFQAPWTDPGRTLGGERADPPPGEKPTGRSGPEIPART